MMQLEVERRVSRAMRSRKCSLSISPCFRHTTQGWRRWRNLGREGGTRARRRVKAVGRIVHHPIRSAMSLELGTWKLIVDDQGDERRDKTHFSLKLEVEKVESIVFRSSYHSDCGANELIFRESWWLRAGYVRHSFLLFEQSYL